jgi:hypothetical protein
MIARRGKLTVRRPLRYFLRIWERQLWAAYASRVLVSASRRNNLSLDFRLQRTEVSSK